MTRLGTVPYLNALPLVEGLEDDPGTTLVREVPSRLAPRLRAGELDAALVSSIELFRAAPLGWVAGPVVASRGPVRSILLFLRCEPARVRSLALDRSSLAAAAMTRVCLARFLGARPEHVDTAAPDAPLEAIDADAVLRIGDPALVTDPGSRGVLDMGEVWTASTGLPFVYALWLTPPDADPGLGPRLRAARDRGVARRETLARAFAREQGMDEERCVDYLDRAIHFGLGPREREGLALYGRLAHAEGLADRAELQPALEDAVRP